MGNPCPKRFLFIVIIDANLEAVVCNLVVSHVWLSVSVVNVSSTRRSTLGKSASALRPRCLTSCLIRARPTSGCPPRVVLLSPPPAVSLLETISVVSRKLNTHAHAHTHRQTQAHTRANRQTHTRTHTHTDTQTDVHTLSTQKHV